MINFSQNPNNPEPASDKHIKEAESQLNMVLPDAYKNLLKQTNGCSVGGDVLLYGTEDITELGGSAVCKRLCGDWRRWRRASISHAAG